MIRAFSRGGHVDIAQRIFALALGLAGCSAPATSGGGGWGTSGGGNGPVAGGGNTTGSSTSGGGAAGTNSGAGRGSNGATSTGMGPSNGSGVGMTSGSPSGTGTGTMTGSSTNSGGTSSASTIPTAQGFTTGPPGATDLAAPPAGDGIHFETPAGAYSVAPGQESFPNYCVVTPSEIQVGGFQSWMSVGSSHHFILYNGGTVAAGTANGSCGVGGHNWMYATSTPGQIITENFPPNVGLDLAANTQLIINMHFINPMSTATSPQVKINLLAAKNVMYQAGTMISFNVQINVPAATASGPGTQTVSGTCSAPTGANFFSMSTHTHKRATAAWVQYIHNGQSTEIVHTGATSTYPADQEPNSGTDWEHPGVGLWVSPNFLTVQAGDSFQYNCSYSNNDSMAVTVGETAASNEMCMAIGYYFPAGSAFCQ